MINNLFKKICFSFLILSTPIFSYAQTKTTATELFQLMFNVIQSLIPIVIGLGVLVFLWGVLNYVLSKEDAGKDSGKKYMFWGVIALFVMVSVWGLVIFLQQTIFTEDPTRPPQQEINQLQEIPDIERVSTVAPSPLMVLINEFLGIITDVIPLIILLAVLVFLWGVFRYAFFEGGKNKDSAKKLMLWGIIGLTVMTFLWGFVTILQKTVFNNTEQSEMRESGDAVNSLKETPKIEDGEEISVTGVGVNKSINALREIIQIAIPYLVSLGILIFIWGVFKYVISENPKEKSSATQFIGWGLVLLLIMSFTWAFVRIISDTVKVDINNQQKPSQGGKINVDNLIIR